MQATLKITIDPLKEDKQVIKFDGEFDKAGHSDIRDQLTNVIKNFEGKKLIFDFSSMKFINSEGVGYLMEIHTHLIKLDKKLVIVGLNRHVKDVFETIGVHEIISVYDTLKDVA